MAERPVFIPAPEAPGLVREKSLTITWAGGFAAVQKKKNVKALHQAAQAIGIGPILEASTKSEEKLGQHLSAFHLKVKTPEGDLPLECAYQGSKVFEKGGPYTDLYFTDARSAKRDPRLHESGKLIAFVFDGHKFPLEPKTVFYDWLYITAIFPHRDWLDRLSRYAGFSDIEFNPQKSINCQARSLALFVSLKKTRLLDEAVRSPESFIEVMRDVRRPGRRTIETPAAEAITEAVDNAAVAAVGAPVVLDAEHPVAAVAKEAAPSQEVTAQPQAAPEPVAVAEPQRADAEATSAPELTAGAQPDVISEPETVIEQLEPQADQFDQEPLAASEQPREAEAQAAPAPEMAAEPQGQAMQGQDTAHIDQAAIEAEPVAVAAAEAACAPVTPAAPVRERATTPDLFPLDKPVRKPKQANHAAPRSKGKAKRASPRHAAS